MSSYSRANLRIGPKCFAYILAFEMNPRTTNGWEYNKTNKQCFNALSTISDKNFDV